MIKLRAIAECVIDLEKGRIEGSSEIHFGILAHLIVERGKPVARGTLVDAFWWNAEETDGRHCLRQAIYKLRQMGVPIEGDGDSFMLGERAALADFDCADERTLALSPLPPEQAVAIFPGYAPRASAPFLTWLERTREKAGRAVRGILVRALGEARRRNGWEEAAKLARQCLVLDPLNEEATLTLAEYTALQGDKREALRLIDSYMEEIGGTYGDLRIPASLLRNRISERVAYPPASAAGKIPLVGREDSLRVLATVATEVNGGAGQTCVIHGPPGIGKTRLITEFANISAMKGARIVRVDCHADAADRALSVFMELAPQLLRMPGALGCSPEALRLVRRLGRHDPNERLDPDEYGGPAFLHAAVRASLRDLIDAIAAERPLYLMIEDVHWIDAISLEVLKEIIGSNRGRALLVLMTTRTLGDGTLLQGVDRRQLIVHELAPLGDDAARRLVETLCGALAIQPGGELIQWCMQRGAGNPLFMTELLAHWRETKDTERVPASLEALIDERVGALSEAALRTLQAIALLEGEATYEMLEAVLGMQRWQVMGCVEELDKGGLVAASPSNFVVRHHLIAAAGLQRLTASVRRILHRAIGVQFEAIGRSLTHARGIWLAATHYGRAGEMEKALRLSLEWAEHLAMLGARAQAVDVITAAGVYATSDQTHLELLDRKCDYLQGSGNYPAIIENSEAAIRLGRRIGNNHEVHTKHEIALFEAWHQPTPRLASTSTLLAKMLTCAMAESASISHRLDACVWGLATSTAEADAEWAERFFDALQLLTPVSLIDQYSWKKSRLIYATIFGSLDSAIEAQQEFRSLIQELPSSLQPAALRICGYPLRLAGANREARRLFWEALERARQEHFYESAATSLTHLAGTYADEGDFDTAWDLMREAIEECTKRYGFLPAPLRVYAAEMLYTKGDVHAAREYCPELPTSSGSRRFWFEVQRLHLYDAVVSGTAVSPNTIESCLRMFRRLRALGWQDFSAGAIGLGLARSDVKRSQAFIGEYLAVRKERYPVRHPLLIRLLES